MDRHHYVYGKNGVKKRGGNEQQCRWTSGRADASLRKPSEVLLTAVLACEGPPLRGLSYANEDYNNLRFLRYSR